MQRGLNLHIITGPGWLQQIDLWLSGPYAPKLATLTDFKQSEFRTQGIVKNSFLLFEGSDSKISHTPNLNFAEGSLLYVNLTYQSIKGHLNRNKLPYINLLWWFCKMMCEIQCHGLLELKDCWNNWDWSEFSSAFRNLTHSSHSKS